MKRDARIGLAVVLVLGLAVTLLVARSISKRAEVAKDDGDSGAPTGTAQYSAEAPRVDGADAAHVSAAAAAAPATPANPAPVTDTAARPAEAPNPSLDKFVQDQTRRIPGNTAPVLLPGEKAPSDTASMPGGGKLTSSAGGDGAVPGGGAKPGAGNTPGGSTPPVADHTAWRDDNDPTSGPSSAEAQASADGFGYTVASGDNIWKISAKVYGDGKYTQKIMDANPGLDTKKMKVGNVIRIPTITHKTVLMKLPSFADAKKGGSSKAPDGKGADAGPVPVSKAVAAPDKAGDAKDATTHKVESGETLSAIAKKYYGSNGPKSIALITAANKGLDPAKLKVGQEIAIPAKTTSSKN